MDTTYHHFLTQLLCSQVDSLPGPPRVDHLLCHAAIFLKARTCTILRLTRLH